ncbi:MAG: hypothetical protein GY696_02040, partial [Gammaproteobacteria bacterium]|nr:hypothetical protein [Gammaproteobacteria bacterium]
QKFYTDEDTLQDGNLELSDGVSISATFDPSTTSSDVQKALSSIGLGKTSLEIDGDIKNMFRGSPSVELTVDIDTPGNHGFKILNIKDTKVEFFMSLSKEEAGLGFRTAVFLSQGKGKSDLEFDVDFGLKESESNIEVQVAGAMKGDWKNAAHIKGFTLENPYMSIGITETGSFDMLIDGTVIIGRERIRAATDMVLSPEALGLPTAFAVAGEIKKLDFNDLVTLSKKHAKQKDGGFKHMNAELKDVAFAFMTPGASLPADLEDELSIEGAGMALKATLLINNHKIASANGYASTEGMSINGKIDPFKLGALQLKDATLDIAAGPSVESKFEMSGDMVLFKGFEEKYLIDIEPSKFELESDTKFGGLFDAKIKIESDGLNFKSSKDVSFDAELATNYTKVFHQLVEGAIKGLKKANKDITNAENSVKSKRDHLTKLNNELAEAKKHAKSSYDHAVKEINDAENKVNKLQKTINYNNKKAHDYHNKAKSDAKHWKFASAGKDKVKEAALKTAVAAEEAALKSAKWALEKAKKADKVVTVDAAPKVVAIQAEIKTAQGALDVSVDFMNAAKAVNSGVADSLKVINKASTLTINKLGVSGSVEGIISGGQKGDKPVLMADVTIHGSHHVYHVTITSYKTEFKKLADTMAKDIAKEIVNVFKK